MKKTVRIINIVLIAAIIMMTLATSVFAITPEQVTGTDGGNDKILSIGNKIVGLIRTVGTIISVGVLVVLGIKYMTASPEGKADYKSTMVPYIVGAIIVFAATWIATAVYQFATSIS